MAITAPTMRRLVEAWHGIRLAEDRAAGLAAVEAAVSPVAEAAARTLTLEDRPSRFRRVLAGPEAEDA